MIKLIILLIILILFIISAIHENHKKEEEYYKRTQEMIKKAIIEALNEKEKEMFNDFGPFSEKDGEENENSNN